MAGFYVVWFGARNAALGGSKSGFTGRFGRIFMISGWRCRTGNMNERCFKNGHEQTGKARQTPKTDAFLEQENKGRFLVMMGNGSSSPDYLF